MKKISNHILRKVNEFDSVLQKRRMADRRENKLIHKAYQFRLYPNRKQRLKINYTLGAVRYVYNYFLREWNKNYNEVGRGLNFAYCSSQLPILKQKEETKWLKKVDSTALQSAVYHLSDAFLYFYKYRTRFPRPKSKNDYYQRFVSKQTKNNILVKDGHVKLPKIGWIKIKQTQEIEGHITSVIVTKEATGRYFISILTRFEETKLPANDKVIAIVLSPDGSFYTSDGQVCKSNFTDKNWLEKLQREESYQYRLKEKAQKEGKPLSEAKNYQKQVRKVARMYAKFENNREDYLHKLSKKLIKEYGVICVPRYLKHHQLSKEVSQRNIEIFWSEFLRKLTYKCHWYGRSFYVIPLEDYEDDLSYQELAKSLACRALKYAESVRKNEI